ncbi:hypothetical protein GPECTOR_31g314 [Gonium pectorale]|uniref:Uncharacterized protein n=1 Tax=Gonium pectorale TaxID=33097 RepID=A0A150GDN5_GONPE|nr:hypothetical protein GPECTOR_31g314 [Gonium pectorale]|eukprot:KXZ47952.1 hypothetical protein GPECTOR_31g314 [Gonium pectorale]
MLSVMNQAWISVLGGLCLAMVVWGMLALDAGLIRAFWDAARAALDYGGGVADGMRGLQTDLVTTLPSQLNDTVSLVNSLVAPDDIVSHAKVMMGSSQHSLE